MMNILVFVVEVIIRTEIESWEETPQRLYWSLCGDAADYHGSGNKEDYYVLCLYSKML